MPPLARLPLGLLATLALGITACDGAAAPAGDGGAPTGAVALAALPARVAAVQCAKPYLCCTADERALRDRAPTEAECEQGFGQFLELFASSIDDSVKAGRARYDGAILAECMRKVEALTCPEARASLPPVITIEACPFLVPRVRAGGECAQSYECINTYCKIGNGGSICVAKKPNDADCQSPDECTSGECNDDAACAPFPKRTACN
jgi:hypothetical protein